MSFIIFLGVAGITVAITVNGFNAIAINANSSRIDANITYDDETNTSSIANHGNLLPISDSLVTLGTEDSRVLKVKFNVSGVESNPDNVIYDVVLRDIDIDCELRTNELKWKLYKNDIILSEGNLSPSFDIMENNRLVLTNTQENLSANIDKYTFLLWISESCEGSITGCFPYMDQSEYLNKKLNGNIKIELSTKSKKELKRVTSRENACA